MASSARDNVDGDGGGEKSTTTRPTEDERLDFFSEKFDPLLALKTPGLEPPVKNAKVYDNIYKYWSVRHTGKGSDGSTSKKNEPSSSAAVATAQPPQRRFLESQMPIKSSSLKYKNILQLEQKVDGPLKLVKKCKDERLPVKVVTRHAHGIRGYCECFIAEFDKYLNLALEEVTETWTRSKKTKIPAVDNLQPSTNRRFEKFFPVVDIINSDKKTETCRRYVKQMLIRGEHIVLISTLANV